MLVIKVVFDEKGESDRAFGTHLTHEFTQEYLRRVFGGPPVMEMSIRSAPDNYEVSIAPPKEQKVK